MGGSGDRHPLPGCASHPPGVSLRALAIPEVGLLIHWIFYSRARLGLNWWRPMAVGGARVRPLPHGVVLAAVPAAASSG